MAHKSYEEILEKQASIVIQKIMNNAQDIEWNCLHPDCSEKSINSHILQRRGILNHISTNNTLIEFSQIGSFESGKKSAHFAFKRKTVNKSLSFPLFCKKHDSDIFKRIEQKSIDFFDYKSHLLFAYRAICAEIRRKDIIIELNNRALRSRILTVSYGESYVQYLTRDTLVHQWGLKDLSKQKNALEMDIDKDLKLYTFKSYKYYPLEVCTSAIFTPFIKGEDAFIYEHDLPFPSCIINIVPQEDGLYVLVGYHKEHVNQWIINYVETLNTNNKIEQECIISNLFATRINTFAISKSVYDKIDKKKLERFLEYWNENLHNMYTNQIYDDNLFG